MAQPAHKEILLVDDDERLGELLKKYLVQFEINVCVTGKDGFEVCKEIRRRHSYHHVDRARGADGSCRRWS